MENSIKKLMMDSMEKVTQSADAGTPDNQPNDSDAPQEPDTGDSVENTSDESNDTNDTADNVTAEKKKKRNDAESRIATKHAEAMHYKELAEKERSEKEALLARIEALEKSSQKEPEEPTLTLETAEDLEAYLKTVPTKKDLEQMVNDLVMAKLNNARETMEQQTREQTHKQKQTEFVTKLVEFYNPSKDQNFMLDDEQLAESKIMMELFESNPSFYLDKVKNKGVTYLKKFISGELEMEEKAEKINSIINKAEAVRTNTSSGANVVDRDEVVKTTNMKGVFKNAAKILQKRGA